MATIVRHFTPETSLNVEDLRKYVSGLNVTTNELSFPNSRQEPSPQRSTSWPSIIIPTPNPPLQLYVPTRSDLGIEECTQADNESSIIDECTPVSGCSLAGEFLPDATLQQRFDGASSFSVLKSRVCSQIPDKFWRLVLLQRENNVDLRDGQPIPAVPVTALPPRRLCEQCGVAFLSQINSVVYILSPEQFFNALETAYRDESTTASTQVIIHLIVALMSNSSDSFQRARLQMETVLEEGSLHSIQAMMLMCLYRLNRNQRHLGWVMLGNAIRLMQSLGLHLRLEEDSLIMAEQKTRLWWSLYELDQWTSTILGQSPEMSIDIRTAPEPCDNFTTGITTPPMYAAASARLAQFLSKAINYIFLQKTYRVEEVDTLLHDMNT
ncbi:hypothetical protein yc1106_06649 [Curvularia clavata]|uniref:Xylanolytic transcriptional activator regulatory domain-containing protein n=1 Tax=Curvularia clavata TaxID=95742 RepID=A0A9Q9DUU9_CURCL|nr:hypothetical protein yc1106_06649 [Curvularia clavata]